MPTISWDEGKPAGADSLGIGDDQIRSDKSAIRTVIDAEHVFPSGGGDAGVHRLGSARPYYGVQSLVSSSGTDARLMQTSDTSQLFHVGSGGTSFIGGSNVISAGSFPGGAPPQRHYWATEFGTGVLSVTTVTVNFPNSGFSGIPFIQLTGVVDPTSVPAAFFYSPLVGKTSMQVVASTHTGARAQGTEYIFHWVSIGTRVL